MPIYDKTQFVIMQLVVGQDLGQVDGEEFIDALVFDDDGVFEEHFHTIAGVVL
jgi:hypothetical protein